MWFLKRFLPLLPAVQADARTREAVEDRVQACRGGTVSDRAGALLSVRDELLWPVSEAWRERCPVDEGELGCEILLLSLAAAHMAGVEDVSPMQDVLIQSVAFGQRERFSDGPEPILRVARGLDRERNDLGPVVVSMTGHRLGLQGRRGGSEGWFLLGTLAWIAGEVLAEDAA